MTVDELPDNIRLNIIEVNDHWIWRDPTVDIKGKIRFNGKNEYAHRITFHLATGFDLTSELQVNHKCPINSCCNPDHLYAGTQADNMKDRDLLGHNKESIKTHCPKGHEYHYNTSSGQRYCQTCKNERRNAWRKSKKITN